MMPPIGDLAPLSRRRLPVPLPSPWFWGLVVLYVLLGLIGHDPWKSEDAIGFGIAWSMAGGHAQDWLLPNIAGRMVAEEGPLAFWLAAAFIKALGNVLLAHDAARLATGVWMSITIVAVYRAGRALDGDVAGRLAVLALLASLGLVTRTHEIAAEPAFLAGWALVLWALARGRAFGWQGALLLTAGLATCYLSRGVAPTRLVVLTIAIAWLATRTGFAGWRDAAWKIGAFAAGHAVFFAWGLTVAEFATEFATEFAAYQAGLQAWNDAQTGWPDAANWRQYGKTLLWFAFPAWPVALWWIAKKRPPMLLDVHPVPLPRRLPLVGAACVLASLAWSPNASDSVLLPLLPPLALLIAPGLAYMRRSHAAAIDWFGRMSFTLVAALIWLGYAALMTGWPPKIAANFARLEPGFVANWQWPTLLVAVAASALWVIAIARSERTPLRGIVHWCYGITLTWLLLMTLWLPWIDYGRSYRPVALSMKAAIAGRRDGPRNCVATVELGMAERATFGYFGEFRFAGLKDNCVWLLTQGTRGDAPPVPAGARQVWEGNRPGDRNERFRLYQRSK